MQGGVNPPHRANPTIAVWTNARPSYFSTKPSTTCNLPAPNATRTKVSGSSKHFVCRVSRRPSGIITNTAASTIYTSSLSSESRGRNGLAAGLPIQPVANPTTLPRISRSVRRKTFPNYQIVISTHRSSIEELDLSARRLAGSDPCPAVFTATASRPRPSPLRGPQSSSCLSVRELEHGDVGALQHQRPERVLGRFRKCLRGHLEFHPAARIAPTGYRCGTNVPDDDFG